MLWVASRMLKNDLTHETHCAMLRNIFFWMHCTMAKSRDALLPRTLITSVMTGEGARWVDAFGGDFFGYYFFYFSFSESLPAGQDIV